MEYTVNTVVKLDGKYAVLSQGSHTRSPGVNYSDNIYAATMFPYHAGVTQIRGVPGEVVRVRVSIKEE